MNNEIFWPCISVTDSELITIYVESCGVWFMLAIAGSENETKNNTVNSKKKVFQEKGQ